MTAIVDTDPEMLRRAAKACRNLRDQQTVGNTEWFLWVPQHLERLADEAEHNGRTDTGASE